MRIKDGIFLMALSLVAGWLVAESKATTQSPIAQDTIKQDTVISVKGKKALFIGDSHSAADYGWQHQVCKKTGMTYLNTAVGGKQTAWMLQEAKLKVTEYAIYAYNKLKELGIELDIPKIENENIKKKKSDFLEKLQKELYDAIDTEDYEKAAEIRDRIKSIEK